MDVNDYIKAELVHEIHTSERRSFRSCRRRWHWIFRENYYPLITAKPLEFGIAYHAALETWYNPKLWTYNDRSQIMQRAKDVFVAACESQKKKVLDIQDRIALDEDVEQDYEERVQLGLGMLEYYCTQVSPKYDNGWKPVKVEISFMVPIPNPETGEETIWCKCDQCWEKWSKYAKQGRYNPLEDDSIDERFMWDGLPVVYAGRLDMLAEDERGHYWIYDWKTASTIMKDEEWLFLDDQIGCVPLDTEILTRSGWKTYDQLVVGEEVLGYSTEEDHLEWTQLEAVHTYKDAETVQIQNKSFSFICTPNHKWVQWEGRNKLEPIPAGKQHGYVVLASTLDNSEGELSPDEAAVIAWILTDGSILSGYRSKNDLQVCIIQKKYVEAVQELLDRFKNSYSRTSNKDGTTTWHLRSPFVRQLWQKAKLDWNLNGWEQFVLGLSSKARAAFCEAGMLAEGSKDYRGSRRYEFYQNPGTKQEMFRLAFFLEGTFPTKSRRSGPTCEVFTTGTPHKWTQTIQVTPNTEHQDVWCPQTGLGTWIMRQQSQIAITGNSYVWALTKLGLPVVGFVYREQRKGFPEPPRMNNARRLGRLFSVNRQQTTDYDTYLETVYTEDRAAYEAGLYEEFLQYLRGEGTEFYSNHQIAKSPEDLQSIEHNIGLEALDMLEPNLRLYPSAGRFSCSFCAFRTPCIEKNSQHDYKYALDTLYEKRQHYYIRTQPSTESKGGE